MPKTKEPEMRNPQFSDDAKSKGLKGSDTTGVPYDKFHTSTAHDTGPEKLQNELREDKS